MQRRSVFYALLGLAPAAQAFQEAAASIPATAAEAVSMGLPRFYSQADLAVFAELGQTLIPAFDGRPAGECPDAKNCARGKGGKAASRRRRRSLSACSGAGTQGPCARLRRG